MTRHVDVLIIGAGLSGIGMACHLTRERPEHSFAILERRDSIGGTWDLFRYPGIRSDSDMYTFGYGFRPWNGTKVLADGPNIRQYIEDTAREYGVTEHIRFGRKVILAGWSSERELWTVTALDERTGATEEWTSRFLVGCTGYYDYDNGYRPEFPGEENFRGRIVHPQHWPEDLDYRGKRVVVIGSGATAITLVPAMSTDAAHVTMLQRSPTYITALPAEDPVALALKKARVPDKIAYQVGRARNIALQRASFQLSRTHPEKAKKLLLAAIRLQVGSGIDMRHFTPSYNPWDQRLCVVPNGDLFKVLRSGKASIVTDRIETFTEDGIRLESGEELPADIIVTATGLRVQMLGGGALEVDGEPVVVRDRVVYKGALLDGIPNAMVVLGYTNASWTLKADLAAEYFCRLLGHMAERGYRTFTAVAREGDRGTDSVMGGALTSGYIQRGDAVMPRQGTNGPWQVINNYFRDRAFLRKGPIEDGVLTFDAYAAASAPVRAAETRSA
ncbi:NAD(P)/FAD-dependent oxidoreductase [Nocardia farcinica]|uniref:flavin-containing monooxygenase n=1 Tax=Nocardia farcinica TaxID=37329 RepID=UPI0018933B14|nr:NAD(P)/FAD-dependent oxidoreductase [Nocardia farcinica]MBF6230703.1 NAD(P)/FAD-dependent oxidoreductase [Nocardia farcinica]MBF6249560.1 NAD(P)/FAD-dependent oxidoreductase [Nocardia farcinica]MBF6260880.1 NAD(P)/FAD-dependent oxidoreductase [Nocardia farcinica]MBF6279452.1 NAD(P)/FAD-dependent oxidoreductase [Nocardia farcinica]MBF6303890.1 NAD(P)/FAD-dependent oxidoreductase [Nocardia farcinica]